MKKIIEKAAEITRKIKRVHIVALICIVMAITGAIAYAVNVDDLTINEVHTAELSTNYYSFTQNNRSAYCLANPTNVTVYGNKANDAESKYPDNNYQQFDFVIVGDNLENITVKDSTGNDLIKDTLVDDALVYRDNSLNFGESETLAIQNPDNVDLLVYVFRAYTDIYSTDESEYHHNEYVTDFFDLEILCDEQLHNSDNSNTAAEDSVYNNTINYKEIKSYRNIYILKNIMVSEDLTLNLPCYINLLNSTVTLKNAFEIKHNYGGLYAIETLDGKIDNSVQNFTIDTPKAYYKTSDTSIVTNQSNFSKSKVNNGNMTQYQSEILDDAKNYISRYLSKSKYIYDDMILPQSYHDYGITYTYSVPDVQSNLTKFGDVQRSTDNVNVQLSADINYNGSISSSVSVNSIVAGTSQNALSAAMSGELESYINASSSLIDGEKYLTGAVDLKLFLDRFCKDISGAYTFTLSNDAGITFSINGSKTVGETITAINDSNVSSITITSEAAGGYTISYDTNKTITNSEAETILLRPSSYVAEATVNITVNTDNSIAVKLKGMSISERNSLLDRYAESIYFTEVYYPENVNTYDGGKRNILQIFNNKIYSGSNVVFNSDMNIQSINYQIYYLSDGISDSTTIENIKSRGTSFNGTPLLSDISSESYFSIVDDEEIQDSVLVLNRAINISDDASIVLLSTVTYNDTDVNSEEIIHESFREIVIPVGGIGSDGTAEYTSGSTFRDRFSNTEGYLSFSQSFSTGNDGVFLQASILDGDTVVSEYPTVNPYCSIETVSTTEAKININLQNVPARDSTVTVRFIFYTGGDINDTSSYISTQDYTFVIPGIYRYGSDENAQINDPWVYLRMLEVYGDYQGYFLIKSAQLSKAEFDCSSSKLNAIHDKTNSSIGDIHYTTDYLVEKGIMTLADSIICNSTYSTTQRSLSGVQFLINTDKIAFDGVNILNLEPFDDSQITGMNVTELSLADCGITDSMLNNVDNSDFNPLYKLNKLTKLNLNNNNISEITNKVYRTVEELHLDSNSLTDIGGITTIPNIKKLYIQNNKIFDFRPLTELGKLEKVYLGDNTVELVNGSNYYGTRGLINLCNYTELCHKGIEIYIDSTQNKVEISSDSNILDTADSVMGSGRFISRYEEYMCVTINSLMYMDSYTDESAALADIQSQLYIASTDSGNSYTVSIVNSSDNVYYVISITDAVKGTVYRRIDLNQNN